jgi:hypothetical protein
MGSSTAMRNWQQVGQRLVPSRREAEQALDALEAVVRSVAPATEASRN